MMCGKERGPKLAGVSGLELQSRANHLDTWIATLHLQRLLMKDIISHLLFMRKAVRRTLSWPPQTANDLVKRPRGGKMIVIVDHLTHYIDQIFRNHETLPVIRVSVVDHPVDQYLWKWRGIFIVAPFQKVFNRVSCCGICRTCETTTKSKFQHTKELMRDLKCYSLC